MSLDHVLYQSPWTRYNTTFVQSRLTLVYPQNLIFTVQLAHHVMHSDMYDTYPNAESIHFESLKSVDWDKAIIVINSDSQVLLAPDPVIDLIRLDRRLHFREAYRHIFKPLQWFPLFRYQWLGIVLIVILGYVLTWSIEEWNKTRVLKVVSSKVSGVPKGSSRYTRIVPDGQ